MKAGLCSLFCCCYRQPPFRHLNGVLNLIAASYEILTIVPSKGGNRGSRPQTWPQ